MNSHATTIQLPSSPRAAGVCFLIAILSFVLGSPVFAGSPQHARHGMVVSGHRIASEEGVDILRRGGNAVDAAVTVGFVLAVVFPEAGNLGGGGYAAVRMHNGASSGFDFRETAPGASTRDMYLDDTGGVSEKSHEGALSAGVPGSVAGLLAMLERYGTMDRRTVIQPAIDIAEKGFVVDKHTAANFSAYESKLKLYPATMKVFAANGHLPREGDTLIQPALAATLRRIRDGGAAEFYTGEISRMITASVRSGGGIISAQDLAGYKPLIHPLLHSSYRGYEILAMPPSTSGGMCLIETLNILEGFNLAAMGYHSTMATHLTIEALNRVYADRSVHCGDPAFVQVPVERLTSTEYAASLRAGIDTMRATPSPDIRSGIPEEGKNTTNFVVIDSAGSAVSLTYTINDLFGSKMVVDGAGFFMNDEMDDFSAKAGVQNAYGLVGGTANSIEPGKRPLSSITPVIVLRDGKPFLLLGGRGGSRIITGVIETLQNVIDYGMNIRDAVEAPRFHAQWVPPETIYEHGAFSPEVTGRLSGFGHTLREIQGGMSAIECLMVDPASGVIEGGPDPREDGSTAGY
jgi:gamma-glutamyltranspeptidase / glutathione hydrolase